MEASDSFVSVDPANNNSVEEEELVSNDQVKQLHCMDQPGQHLGYGIAQKGH